MPAPPSFWRSPRLRSALPKDEIEIPAPADKPSPPGSLLPLLLPAILTVVVMVAIGLLAKMSNWLLFSVPMMLVSSLASLLTYQFQKRSYHRQVQEREQKYSAILKACQQKLHSYQQVQQRILLQKDPDPVRCLAWVAELRRNLWARSPSDDDFLCLRIGLGRQPSTVNVKVPRGKDFLESDPLTQTAKGLAERFNRVPNVPVCLALRDAGVAGVAGPRSMVLNTARALLIQLATHHSPDEVKIAAIYPTEEEEDWAWLRWLPHVWSDDHRRRFLANDKESAHQLLKAVEDLLNRRRDQLRETRSAALPAFPFCLVFFLADPSQVEGDPIVQCLQAEGPRLGAFPIFLAERVKTLPKSCQQAVRLSQDKSYLFLIESRIQRLFVPDRASKRMADDFARAIAPIRLRKQASEKGIPPSLSLLDLLQVRTVEDLQVLDRWHSSETVRRSLAVPIGMRAGAEPLMLDLHERAHGPNGLVAGMVGAGKSELLQTLVASSAVHFHPHKVAFVLVDYKGGGMADPFVELPHTLGVITNLQKGNLAIRALTSFNVEAERRQRLFAKAGVNHIDDYQRLYYKGQVEEPLPYLVIIVDEFAEMKTEQPDVAKEFVRIARLGRALGFRLILAMQKPAGIVDGQIEANTRFRLCLRVAQTEDSQAMLKRPEAAYLSGVGRAYFQVGVNEVFELFQVAWSGAPYDPNSADTEDPLEIVEIGLDGSCTPRYRPPRPRVQADLTQLKALVAHLKDVAERANIQGLPRPWLPPLPEQIALEQVYPRQGWNGQGWEPIVDWLEPTVGFLDDPKHTEQRPLRIKLGKEGHLCIYGAPGYGSTTFVQTLVTSLVLGHSPADINLYLLDFGGRLLKLFEGLPHVGAVITADEPERVNRLLRYVVQEMERRKELFGQASVSTLVDYRTATGEVLPAIIVILDKYPAFVEAFEEAVDTIAHIAREGGNLGVHLVLTANSSADVRHKVRNNINLAVTLYQGEQGEYSAIVGRTDGLVPEPVPGRGLVKGTPVLEFQTVLPAKGNTDAERSAALKALINQMAEAWDGPLACPVRRLPDVVALSDLLPLSSTWTIPDSHNEDILAVPVGLNVSDLEPCIVGLRMGPNFIIGGSAQSGKTTLLQTWLLALAERCHPDRLHLYLLDSRRVGLSPLVRLPHVKAYACEENQVSGVLQKLEQLLQERQQIFRRKTQDLLMQQESVSQFPAVVLAIEDLFDPSDDTISAEAKKQLAAMARQGRRLGFYQLVTGSSTDLAKNSWDELVKTLRETQAGFMLGISDDSVFNLHLPHREREQILPIGEAYFTQRGQSRRVKLATAHLGNPTLSSWIDLLCERYKACSIPCA